MTTAHGSASLSPAQSHDDQTWHHIALQRSAGQLLLWVDDTQVASASAVSGSISQRVSFQIQLAQRLDNTQRLHGTLDEVRLYTHALSPTDLDQIRLTNAAIPTGLALHLPIDKIHP